VNKPSLPVSAKVLLRQLVRYGPQTGSRNPDAISKTVLSKGLDAGTAFEILSIDIADIDGEEMSVPSCRQTRRKRINVLPRQKLKKEELWLLQGNRK